MDLACETEIPVQNEHALCFSIISKPVPILDYLKAVSTLVGASHILAVYEENDTIKVYFDDKRFMHTIIKTGIHILGQHVKIDYAVPPGVKVFLTNIDPVITNMDLEALLNEYGTVASPIIRMPLCEDAEFCHIDYGVRYVYMQDVDSLPNKIECRYGEKSCVIKLGVNYELALLPSTKLEDIDSSDSERAYTALGAITAPPNGNDQVPVLVSVHSAGSEIEVLDVESENVVNRPTTRRKRRLVKTLRRRRAKITATTRAAKKIKQNVKYKLMGKKHVNNRAHLNDNKQIERILSSSPPLLEPNDTTFSSINADGNVSTLPLLKDDSSPNNSSNGLSDMKLKMFIKEVKFRRVPFTVLNKYLGDNYDNDKLLHLIDQLKKFNSRHKCNSLKLRISRLINTLKKAL